MAICIEYVEVEKKKVQVYMNIMTTRTNNHRTNNVVRALSCMTNGSICHEIIFHYRSFQKQFQIERGRLFDRSVNKKKRSIGEEGEYARISFI